MDVLSFNLVLSTIDSLIAERGFASLVHAVALYKEVPTHPPTPLNKK